MRSNSFPILALVVLLISQALMPAHAQQHRATRLGNPAHRFAKPLQKPEDLRALFKDPKLRADVESVLRQANWQGDVEDLRKAAATAEIGAVRIPVGTRLPFMSTRRQGKPVALIDVEWAGKEAMPAYEFDFASRGRRYRCLTPKPCANFLVIDLGPLAALELTRSMPGEVSLCEPFEMKLTVRNSGGAALSQVRIEDSLLSCVPRVEPGAPGAIEVGALQPGETREIRIRLRASAAGTCEGAARVTSAQGASADAAGHLIIKAPVLGLTCTAPASVTLNRPVQICLVVTNSGNAPEARATVSLPIPAGSAATAVTEGGVVQDGRVVWQIADLAPGTARTLCAAFGSPEVTTLAFTGSVTGTCSPPAKSECATRVLGIPAILLEVVDLEDPVEIGKPVTYEIRVTNQGSAALSNVRLQFEMAESQEFVSGDGATAVKGQGRTGSSEPYATLEPKAMIVWRVVAKALSQADARFKVDLTSDQFLKPVEEYEATSQY